MGFLKKFLDGLEKYDKKKKKDTSHREGRMCMNCGAFNPYSWKGITCSNCGFELE